MNREKSSRVWFKYFLFLFFSLLPKLSFAQTDSVWLQKPEVNVSGFVDIFYAYDFNKPEGNTRQPFFYNHNRHNEFNLNLGFVKIGINHPKYRANLAFQAGTYGNDNYAAEPGLLKNIFEANAGLSLNKKNNLWLDAGIFSSHIGFEGAISIDNWTLTRSLSAENSPYYLSGAKLTYNPNLQWEMAVIVCNGWQRIQKIGGNSLPSFGTQLKYIPSSKVILNWSTFIGTDDPDSTRRMRYFNSIFGQFQLSDKFGLIAGFDLGAQQKSENQTDYSIWFTPTFIARYAFREKWASSLRAEYYQDETGIIIPVENPNGFKTTGLSLNIDYIPVSNVACRLEGRWLKSSDKIFQQNSQAKNNDFFIVSSLAIRLN